MSLQSKPKFAVLRSVESFANPRPSIKHRMRDGKALRKKVSLKDQGKYTVPKNRIDPVAILENQAKFRIEELIPDRKSTRLNSSHTDISRMPSSA